MRIFADKLADHLPRSQHGIFLVFGNEPLLLQESREAIQRHAQSLGFEERHRFAVDAQLDWNLVYDCCQALSLFSARQIIELEIPETGVNAATGKELIGLADKLHPDIMLVIIGHKLTKQQENAKWFKALSANGCVVTCLTPDTQRLPQFVQQRCRKLNLVPDNQAIQMLAQWHEGNLLALSQSLEKLALLYPDGQLTLLRVEEALSRHNHFTPFQWSDALLAGQSKRAQRILRQLEAEGTEAIILLRTLQKELLLILEMHKESTSLPLGKVFDARRIWQTKRPMYSAALQRLAPTDIQKLLSLTAQAEINAKTRYDRPVWLLLAQISLQFCEPKATFNIAL
ncbi:DNA polymerase III subunit delta [Vibrio penaeicida]|uniref:DNA polymerase III subunit delta n=1 Tax=Vibrio penaeicida TaxID=104609 RepID=A0AAV5NWM2_9VIBR|nr:DNA polymerase III subunit delta [Vibrio penaeicida]RTZ24830.1 DNA polymerase III subunit delta [Vibrio penaeicida]GLQ74980.1 DNA polymerase III subunit delta [Vibrio penaeicida]